MHHERAKSAVEPTRLEDNCGFRPVAKTCQESVAALGTKPG
jgi:hypothetical protein